MKISRLNFNGKEQVIRIIGSGEFMGELSLFNRSGTAPGTDKGHRG
ncbi:MAG: hypothetical protein PHV32_05790 [Eubacteriales bacterium]|nr:hypothetical protein [Eubacteriales bacterium]